jgi:hypothetical protein
MSDFYHVIEERQRGDDRLDVTGILNPQDMTAEGIQKNAIVVMFTPQPEPKDSWESARTMQRD